MTTTIAERIKNLRKARGLTQEEMAEKLHISQSSYARIENGESHSWAYHIKKISDIFEIKPKTLLAEQFKKSEQDDLNQITEKVNQLNDVVNFLSERLINQYEKRIADLEKQVQFWKEIAENK